MDKFCATISGVLQNENLFIIHELTRDCESMSSIHKMKLLVVRVVCLYSLSYWTSFFATIY